MWLKADVFNPTIHEGALKEAKLSVVANRMRTRLIHAGMDLQETTIIFYKWHKLLANE